MSLKIVLYPPLIGNQGNYSIGLRRELGRVFSTREGFGPRVPFAFSLGCLINRTRYIHFDWVHMYYQNNNMYVSLVKTIVFSLDLLMLKYILRARIIVVLHNIKPHNLSQIPFSDWFCQHLILAMASGVRYFSSYTQRLSERYFKYSTMQSDVFPETSYSYDKPLQFRENLKDFRNTKILVVGNILPYKNIHELLFVISDYLVENNAILTIAGRAIDESYAKSLITLASKLNINKNIHFDFRWLEEADLCKLIAMSSVIVNYQKRFTNTGILEYCRRYEKPLITRNRAGIAECYINKDLLFSNANEFLNKIRNIPNPPYYKTYSRHDYSTFVAKICSQ